MENAMNALEPFQVVVNRYCLDPADEPEATIVSLAACLRTGADPRNILRYLTELGMKVRAPKDLLQINHLPDEDSLGAIECSDGVAVSSGPEGWFVLFTE